MRIFTTTSALRFYLKSRKELGLTIGFCPTMGALHQGHISLIQAAQSKSDITVCSIFVNPTQFNEQEDLAKYPRTIASDMSLLMAANCDVLYLPDVDEVYPSGTESKLNLQLGKLAEVMEGEFRPGHFEGMCQVVHRLLTIVTPDFLFMGQKDYQQQAIVQHMIRRLEMEVTLVRCPIVRNESGLALSSRNARLTDAQRESALIISKTLRWIMENIDKMSIDELKIRGSELINQAGLRTEYLEISDGTSLQPISKHQDHKSVVSCVAAWCGEVRLIDNIVLFE